MKASYWTYSPPSPEGCSLQQSICSLSKPSQSAPEPTGEGFEQDLVLSEMQLSSQVDHSVQVVQAPSTGNSQQVFSSESLPEQGCPVSFGVGLVQVLVLSLSQVASLQDQSVQSVHPPLIGRTQQLSTSESTPEQGCPVSFGVGLVQVLVLSLSQVA